jgi:hypothetical protein
MFENKERVKRGAAALSRSIEMDGIGQTIPSVLRTSPLIRLLQFIIFLPSFFERDSKITVFSPRLCVGKNLPRRARRSTKEKLIKVGRKRQEVGKLIKNTK